jgi:hypothetical protein
MRIIILGEVKFAMRKEYMKNMWMLVLMSVMLGQGVVALTSGTPGAQPKMAPVGTPSPGSTPGKAADRSGGFFSRSPKKDSPTDLSNKSTQDIFSGSGIAPSILKQSALTEEDPRRKALYAGMALYRNQNERAKQLTVKDEQQLQAIPGAVEVLGIAQATAEMLIIKNTRRVSRFKALSPDTFAARSAPSGGGAAGAGGPGGAPAGPGGAPAGAQSTAAVLPDASSAAQSLELPSTIEGLRGLGVVENGSGQFVVQHPQYGQMKVLLGRRNEVMVIVTGPDGAEKAFHNSRNGDSFTWTPQAIQYFEGMAQAQRLAEGTRSRAQSGENPGGDRDAGLQTPLLVTGTGQGANPEDQPVPGQGVGAGSAGSPPRSRAASASGQGVGPLGQGPSVTDPAAPLVGGDPATDPQRRPIVPAPVEPKNYKAAFGFAVPAAIVGAIWLWLAATKQGRELLGSMRKLFTKKGRASLTPQQKREAIEDLVTLAVTSSLGVASGGYAAYSARKTYTHNKNRGQGSTATAQS